MKIWRHDASIDNLNEMGKSNMGEHLRMNFIEIGDDYLIATMPVDERTKQPFGILHGGATAALAETLGSVASQLCIDENEIAVGTQLNVSHLNSVRNGLVKGKCIPIKIGNTMHRWQIDIYADKSGKHITNAQLTTFIKKFKS